MRKKAVDEVASQTRAVAVWVIPLSETRDNFFVIVVGKIIVLRRVECCALNTVPDVTTNPVGNAKSGLSPLASRY